MWNFEGLVKTCLCPWDTLPFIQIKGVAENVWGKKLMERTFTSKIYNKDTRYAALQLFAGITGRREVVTTETTYLKDIKIGINSPTVFS